MQRWTDLNKRAWLEELIYWLASHRSLSHNFFWTKMEVKLSTPRFTVCRIDPACTQGFSWLGMPESNPGQPRQSVEHYQWATTFLLEYCCCRRGTISFDSQLKASVVNKQTESHKGFIFYLHEVELLYNDVHHSQLTL